MADLDVNAWVTRTELQMSNLQINDGTVYTLARGLNPGTVSWRKQTVESPFYEGRYVVHEVKDAVEVKIPIYVHGTTHTNLDLNINALIEAFAHQSSFDLHVEVENRPYAWTCERADYEVGFVAEMLQAFRVPVHFTTMRVPTQLLGPL